MFYCIKCRKEFIKWRSLTVHFANLHREGYCKCDRCGKEYNNFGTLRAHKGVCLDPEKMKDRNRKISISNKGRAKSEEHKEHISEALIGISKSEEAKNNMKIAQKKYYKENPEKAERNRQLLKSYRIKMSNDPYYKELKSIQAIKQNKDPNNDFGYSKNKFCYYKNIRFRSSREKKFAIKLDLVGLDWEFEKEYFKIAEGRRYLPDFYLPELDLYIDVKPECFKNEASEKINLFKEKYNKKLKMLDLKEFDNFVALAICRKGYVNYRSKEL